MSDSVHPLWGRKAAQIALALCCFALPILFTPLASRESGTDLWVRAGLSKSTVKKVLIPAGTVPSLYTLVADQGVYRSSDNGVTWRAVNNGLPPAQWGRIGVQALAVDEDKPFVLYAGMQEIGGRESAFGTGLYVSGDDGAAWLPLGRDMVGKEVQTIAVLPALALSGASGRDEASPTSVVCVATGGELYRSADRGQSWSRLDWRGVETRILSLAIHPANPDIIYVGTQGGGIYSTEDGGVSWVAMNQGLDDVDVREIAISVNEPRLMYLATNGGVYKSLDAGWTWTRLGGATEGRFVNTIALHPQDGRVLYVGLQHGAAFCSMDGGTEWTAVKRGLGDLSVLALALDPRNPSVLWAGTTDGIWRCILGASVSLTATGTVSTASATPRPEPTSTAASTGTPMPTPTLWPSATASPTASPTHTAPATTTVPPTVSPTTTYTPTPSATVTPTLTERAAPPPPTLTPPAPTETPIR
jgi:hypothetical protein